MSQFHFGNSVTHTNEACPLKNKTSSISSFWPKKWEHLQHLSPPNFSISNISLCPEQILWLSSDWIHPKVVLVKQKIKVLREALWGKLCFYFWPQLAHHDKLIKELICRNMIYSSAFPCRNHSIEVCVLCESLSLYSPNIEHLVQKISVEVCRAVACLMHWSSLSQVEDAGFRLTVSYWIQAHFLFFLGSASVWDKLSLDKTTSNVVKMTRASGSTRHIY